MAVIEYQDSAFSILRREVARLEERLKEARIWRKELRYYRAILANPEAYVERIAEIDARLQQMSEMNAKARDERRYPR